MIFYHLVNDRNAKNFRNTCVERFFRRLMGQKSVFYSEFSENNCNAVLSLESGFPFFETMNFDGSKSAGRSSSIIFPKALSKTRLNWLKYRYMRNVSKKIKHTLNQMPIISISFSLHWIPCVLDQHHLNLAWAIDADYWELFQNQIQVFLQLSIARRKE